MLRVLSKTCFIVWLLAMAIGDTSNCIAIDAAKNPPAPPTAEQLEFFERSVRPLLAEHCYSCHSSKTDKLKAGLLVDSRDGLLRGGDSGAAILPGIVDESLLISAVRYENYEMPPKGKLPASDVETLERWIAMGAPWPVEAAPAASQPKSDFDLLDRKSQHWVWQPIIAPKIPEVKDKNWPRNELDRFVLSSLEAKELAPAADAERSALLRRLSFDLIGLPPTPAQTKEFLADSSPNALERTVDKLLESPHFGERWGRHWLDLVRYAESRGHEFDNDSLNAFQYRDYVIRAFNADVPYDQLVREHIAGDLLARPRLNPTEGFNESILGTGFWFLGEWVHSPVDIRKDESDRFDNMIDVMSKAFLGVTVSCARCHDHKFDAISTADYYSLSGFLQSSDYRQVPFESLEHNRQIADELFALDTKFQQDIFKQLAVSGIDIPKSTAIDSELEPFIVFDYGSIAHEQYMQDGFLFGREPRRMGDAYLETNDAMPIVRFAQESSAVCDSFWDGLESVSERGVHDKGKLTSLPRSGRTLRSPTFALTDGKVACRVKGAGHLVACVDSHRLIAGPLHGETIKAIAKDEEWVELNLQRYVGHRLHLEFTPDENAHLSVSLITQGASKKVQRQLSENYETNAATIKGFSQAAERVLGEAMPDVARNWSEERTRLQAKVMKRSQTAMAMMDGSGEDDHILIRGNSSKPGEIEPRHFLTAVAGNQPMPIKTGSGRLELANQINDPANPLTNRVIVNRIWHHLMGRGIVPTTDDFGVLGQRPTHPELLDQLATQFVKDGYSIKQTIRRIALSRTYQMSSHSLSTAIEADPKNLLWHHRPPKRLEGEAIRDTLLSLSGRIDPKQFGEPVPIHLTSFMDGRGRPKKSGPLDGDGRRSIYIAVRRNFLSPFMLTFDMPVPFSAMGRRNVSNVPAQSLILMNDPFVVEQARLWADRALKQGTRFEDRIEWMYESAFARPPTLQEMETALSFLHTSSKEVGEKSVDIAIWSDFAHALINTKEFIFLR
jgi:Protein of unknown function (DUF1553)/Protein of unknown function (DUF1549)/Planctomycete cytochrome C